MRQRVLGVTALQTSQWTLQGKNHQGAAEPQDDTKPQVLVLNRLFKTCPPSRSILVEESPRDHQVVGHQNQKKRTLQTKRFLSRILDLEGLNLCMEGKTLQAN